MSWLYSLSSALLQACPPNPCGTAVFQRWQQDLLAYSSLLCVLSVRVLRHSYIGFLKKSAQQPSGCCRSALTVLALGFLHISVSFICGGILKISKVGSEIKVGKQMNCTWLILRENVVCWSGDLWRGDQLTELAENHLAEWGEFHSVSSAVWTVAWKALLHPRIGRKERIPGFGSRYAMGLFHLDTLRARWSLESHPAWEGRAAAGLAPSLAAAGWLGCARMWFAAWHSRASQLNWDQQSLSIGVWGGEIRRSSCRQPSVHLQDVQGRRRMNHSV